MLKIRRPLGRLIFNMGIAIPGKTVFLIETAPWTKFWTRFQIFRCCNIPSIVLFSTATYRESIVCRRQCQMLFSWTKIVIIRLRFQRRFSLVSNCTKSALVRVMPRGRRKGTNDDPLRNQQLKIFQLLCTHSKPTSRLTTLYHFKYFSIWWFDCLVQVRDFVRSYDKTSKKLKWAPVQWCWDFPRINRGVRHFTSRIRR